MWAIIDDDSQTVIACLTPEASEEYVKEMNKKHKIVLMTLENSPAWIGGTYNDGRFYPPK